MLLKTMMQIHNLCPHPPAPFLQKWYIGSIPVS